MKKQRLTVLLAFSLLLVVATVIGCGTLGVDGFLIPVGSNFEAKFLYAVNAQEDSNVDGLTISGFSVDPATGKLTPVPGSPFTTSASGCCGTLFIDVDPNSRFLYVPNRDAASVSVFGIDSTGKLTQIAGSPFPTGGSDVFAVILHPNGNFLYAADRSNDTVTVFSIGSDGHLTSLGSVDTSGSARQMFIDPQGRFLYVSDESEGGVIDGFTIGANGGLTPINGSPFGNLNCPRSGTVDFAGKFLLVADRCNDTVSVYSIDQNSGALTEATGQGSPFTAGDSTFGVVEVVAGGTTYMAVNNLDASVSVFTFDTSTGKLVEINGSPFDLGLSWAHYIAVDPSGKFGYIADFGNGNIQGLTVGANGDPTAISGSPFSGGGLTEPSQIVISH